MVPRLRRAAGRRRRDDATVLVWRHEETRAGRRLGSILIEIYDEPGGTLLHATQPRGPVSEAGARASAARGGFEFRAE